LLTAARNSSMCLWGSMVEDSLLDSGYGWLAHLRIRYLQLKKPPQIAIPLSFQDSERPKFRCPFHGEIPLFPRVTTITADPPRKAQNSAGFGKLRVALKSCVLLHKAAAELKNSSGLMARPRHDAERRGR
jgi:hypothetical protein